MLRSSKSKLKHREGKIRAKGVNKSKNLRHFAFRKGSGFRNFNSRKTRSPWIDGERAQRGVQKWPLTGPNFPETFFN